LRELVCHDQALTDGALGYLAGNETGLLLLYPVLPGLYFPHMSTAPHGFTVDGFLYLGKVPTAKKVGQEWDKLTG
jgi:hypothetical protein